LELNLGIRWKLEYSRRSPFGICSFFFSPSRLLHVHHFNLLSFYPFCIFQFFHWTGLDLDLDLGRINDFFCQPSNDSPTALLFHSITVWLLYLLLFIVVLDILIVIHSQFHSFYLLTFILCTYTPHCRFFCNHSPASFFCLLYQTSDLPHFYFVSLLYNNFFPVFLSFLLNPALLKKQYFPLLFTYVTLFVIQRLYGLALEVNL